MVKRFHCADWGDDYLTGPCTKKFNKRETFNKHLLAHQDDFIAELERLAALNGIADIDDFIEHGYIPNVNYDLFLMIRWLRYRIDDVQHWMDAEELINN